MFGVVLCGRCHRPKGVGLSTAKVKCPHCGSTIDVKRAKIFFQTDSQSELAKAVRAMAESRWDISSKPPPRMERKEASCYDEIVSGSEAIHDLEERLRFVAKGINAIHDPFTKEDLSEVTEDPEEALKRMIALDLVFEPSPGRYRYLG